jgi:hypothetical protein
MTQIISASYDPSVSGLPGNVGEIIQVAGGATAWVKFDTGVTDWRAFPEGGGAVADGSITLAKLADLAALSVIGRAAGAGTGVPQALTRAQLRAISGVISPFHERMLTLQASLATFTGTRYIPLGLYPVGVAIASRSNNQAGLQGPGALSTATPLALTNCFTQTPKTLPWFAGFRAKFAGTFTGSNYALLGAHDGSTDFVRCGYAGGYSNSFWSFDVGHGGSSTPATSSIALDTNAHDHAVYYDGSTACTYYIDGVAAAVISTLTNFPTTAQSLMLMANPLTISATECYVAFNETT